MRGKRRLTDQALIENFGLSFEQVKILADKFPKPAIGTIVRQFAKFLLAGDSSTELKWRTFAPPIIEAVTGEKPVWIGHNAMHFTLPGATYKPDFGYQLEGGRMIFVEVKASKLQPGYRDARSKLRAAATLYPMFTFYEAMPDKTQANGWSFELIEPDPAYADVFIQLMEAQ